jgi:hypothetical protein
MSTVTEVKTKLVGKDAVLRPSLRAAKKLDAFFGGIGNGFQPLRQFNLAAYTAVIAAGLGKTDEEVEEAVYETGLANLAGDASLFLSLLTLGGSMPEKDDKKNEGENKSGE